MALDSVGKATDDVVLDSGVLTTVMWVSSHKAKLWRQVLPVMTETHQRRTHMPTTDQILSRAMEAPQKKILEVPMLVCSVVFEKLEERREEAGCAREVCSPARLFAGSCMSWWRQVVS